MDAIVAKNLCNSFGCVTAVNDVSITIPEGGIFGFLGPNGAGKTTTIRIGDLLVGAIFGVAITTIVFSACVGVFHIPVASAGLLGLAFALGSVAFAALGTLLASPTTDNTSNIMMLSSLIRLPLIFISGTFIPLAQLTGPLFFLTSLSPLTYLVDLLHAALNSDGVYPPWLDALVLVVVIILFIWCAKVIQKRNLVKGI